jgi:plastocyanin
LAAVLVLAGVWGGGVEHAGAADCAWHRHSKRVVKQVRRHGRPHRVVRVHHWWTCDAVAPSSPALPVPPLPPAAPEPAANRLGVRAAEFYFVLSRPEVSAGEVTVELNNQGEDAHNLNLQLQGSEGPVIEIPEATSEHQSVAHFELPAGSYKLWCSLPTHEEEGMHTTLVVGAG